VFVRGYDEPYDALGTLWLSDARGADVRQISPAGLRSSFVGSGYEQGLGKALYLLTEDSDSGRSVWRHEVASGESTAIFSFTSIKGRNTAGVSPDGHNIVFADATGMNIHDLQTGQTRRLLDFGDYDACVSGTIGECDFYFSPLWSPDGALFMATRGGYEPAWIQAFDPFTDPPLSLISDQQRLPFQGRWAPNSSAICAMGFYLESSGLYLFKAPNWLSENAFPEYEFPPDDSMGRSVTDCGWTSDSEVAYIANTWLDPVRSELRILDVATGESRLARVFEPATCCSGRLIVVDGTRMVVTQHYQSDSWAQPHLVDIDTGEAYDTLNPGDFVVAGFANAP